MDHPPTTTHMLDLKRIVFLNVNIEKARQRTDWSPDSPLFFLPSVVGYLDFILISCAFWFDHIHIPLDSSHSYSSFIFNC